MKRKVIKQGHNTLTITLPSKWAKKHGILPGQEIDLAESEHSLVIGSKKGNVGLQSTLVDVTGLPEPLIWRYLLSAYRSGYKEIRVQGIGNSKKNIYSAFSYNTLDYLKMENGINMSPMEVVSACVSRMIGMEIVEQKESFCVIRELSETGYSEFNRAIKRMLLLLRIQSENIKDALAGKKDAVKSVHMVDTSIDRFEDFCLRVLNKNGYEKFRKTSNVYSFVFTLELIGDEMKKIGMHILENGHKNSDAIIKLFDFQIRQLERLYKLHTRFDKQLTIDIFDYDAQGTKLIKTLRPKITEYERDELVHHFKKIGVYVLSLTELLIDQQF